MENKEDVAAFENYEAKPVEQKVSVVWFENCNL